MAIDQTVIARVLGVGMTFKDMRVGSALNLPMRIYVIAQGASAAVYSNEKFLATSASMVGDTVGYGSQAHLIAEQLLPVNGDGVGTIPVTFFPLDDDGSGVAAAGVITPSGTQTEAAEYQVNVNNIMSEEFVIAASASVSARCRGIHDAINAVLRMPLLATYTYGTVTSSAVAGGTGNGTCTVLSAPGQPTPGVYRLSLVTVVANGGVWKLVDPDGVELADDITMTPGAGGATVITSNGLQFTLTDGSTDFGSGAYFDITVPAATVVLTSKWKGVTANDLIVSVEGEDLGTTFTITQPTGGLVNPDVQVALDAMGNVWETLVINAMGIDDDDALDAIQVHGEGRWDDLVHKPFMSFVGNTATTRAAATAVSSTRRTDRINGQLVLPGSDDLPFVVAARQVARIAKVANNNPPTGYGAQRATGLTPGADSVQWNHTVRDQAAKLGSSTVEIIDGVPELADIVTFYRPTGEEPPAYRFVVDVIKIMNIMFNVDLEFAKAEWRAAPLIPDDQVTENQNARKPKHAKARLAKIYDALGRAALISDPKTAKTTIGSNISGSNPKRLSVGGSVQISGNTDIIDVQMFWGFYYGTAPTAA